MPNGFDFSGYATRNDLKCADGRTIRKNAFKDCDGITVPLVWQHQHNNPANVLGHAILENRDDGVYAYGIFNETEAGKNAKELVRHGDIKAMSIYANQLIQKGGDVLHGMIREVSLVMAGANPGALIEDLSFEHFDDEDTEFEAIIHNDENVQPYVPDPEPEPEREVQVVELDDEEPDPEVYEEELEHSADEEETSMANSEATVKEIYNSMNQDQKDLCAYLVGQALAQNAPSEEDDETMAHNLFENEENYVSNDVLIHDAFQEIVTDAKRNGSMREAYERHIENDGVLAHIDTTGMTTSSNVQSYFVNDPSFLFPEARSLNNPPEWIKRDMDWVTEVLGKTHHTPFSRIKSVFANITENDARAKGYIKAHQKTDEVFTLLKRTTSPQTIYKKQKIDRDDLLDITDFDVIQWIKSEMRMMLNEEIARAILIGDGRSISSDDKINEANVRPIVSDAPLFTIQAPVAGGDNMAKNLIRGAVRARKDYKGSGNPVLFTTEEYLTEMLLIEDGLGHPMYKTESELATAMRVSKIVTVPVMENITLTSGNALAGIIVNLSDYNVGADKGGEINMFDDFDIDYNQQKYLIETRISGALIKPYSAIVLSILPAEEEEEEEEETPGTNG